MADTLSSAIDAPALHAGIPLVVSANEFRSKGRTQVPTVLARDSALRLYRELQRETRWTVTFNERGKQCEVERCDPESRAQLIRAAWERARDRFQFIYDRHDLSMNRAPYRDRGHYFSELVRFLNAPEFLGAARRITGMTEIAWADAQATLYRPGDFLTLHDDGIGGTKRLAAYVLSMTPDWRADWGGLLLFFDGKGNVTEGYTPAFNVLNVFRVPAKHAVTLVAPFGGMRYSVTGWLHAN